jgi:alcohol dehydrogenase (cytochrome c)
MRTVRFLTTACLAAAAFTFVLSAQRPAVAPAFDGAALTALPRDGWLTNGGDLFNRRYSPLTQITRDNVASLKAVWRVRLGSGTENKYSGEATPVVYNGVIYVVTGADDVFAVSVESGQVLWSYRANLDQAINTICCGWTSRGVGLGDGRLYVGQLDGKLVALDQQTGRAVWTTQAERWQDGFSITTAPLYYDGLVITGFAGAEYGVRGRVKAFDAADGHLVWTFYTIPGPGEVGHETWPQDSKAWERGGASVWQTPAVDPALGLLYFSTGNAGPDFNGAARKGDNLFASSIVAVEAKTGKYRWHFQQVHHDIWDYDSPNPVVLFDLAYRGTTRKALAQASKTGWVYILDRATGRPIVGIEERRVPQEPRQATSPTQPFPVGDTFVPQSMTIAPEGFTLVNQGRIFTPFFTDPIVAKPGQGGGANWGPSSYDPTSGYLYVCAQDRTGIFRAEAGNANPPAGQQFLGGRFGSITWGVTGIFAALDMRTNKLVWQQQWPERCYSGSTVTASGLVFIGRGDGRLTALDARSGGLLWQFQTGAGVNAPPSIFEHQGQQDIAVYSGGSLFAGAARGDSLWLFSTSGMLGPVPPAGAATAPATAAGH